MLRGLVERESEEEGEQEMVEIADVNFFRDLGPYSRMMRVHR